MISYEQTYGLYSLYNDAMWDPPGFLNAFGGTPSQYLTFERTITRTFAQRMEGKVYLLLPYGTAPPVQGYFWEVEWPILRDGGRVTEIVWIDANLLRDRPFEAQSEEDLSLLASMESSIRSPFEFTTTWWKQGDARPVTQPGDKPKKILRLPRTGVTTAPTAGPTTASETKKKTRKKPKKSQSTPTPSPWPRL